MIPAASQTGLWFNLRHFRKGVVFMATYNGIVLGGALKFRKTPSTSGTIMTSFPTGTKLSVSTVTGNDSWYKTTVSSYGTGYVMKAYVAVKDDTVKVTGNDVNVRASASTSGTRLYALDEGATATVQDVDSNWVKIKPSGKSAGWINAQYVNKTSGGGSSGGTTGGTLIKGASFSGTHSNLVTGAINIRKEPSTSSDKVGSIDDHQVDFNTYYTFTGVGTTTQQQEWLYVSTNYAYGYVLAKLIGSGGNTTSKHSITGSGVRLRSTPNTSSTSNVITTMDLGEKVDVIDSTSVSGWYRVVTMNGTGWVSSSYVKENR